jgi:hypothetical protein
MSCLAIFDRLVNFPGIGVSVQDMMDSLARVAGKDNLDLLEMLEEENVLKTTLDPWPADFDNKKAISI